jgi:hypothetical protein
MHLAHGGVAAALAMNPLIAFSVIAAILYLLYSIVTMAAHARRIQVALTVTEKDVVRVGAVLILLINWAYLIFNL